MNVWRLNTPELNLQNRKHKIVASPLNTFSTKHLAHFLLQKKTECSVKLTGRALYCTSELGRLSSTMSENTTTIKRTVQGLVDEFQGRFGLGHLRTYSGSWVQGMYELLTIRNGTQWRNKRKIEQRTLQVSIVHTEFFRHHDEITDFLNPKSGATSTCWSLQHRCMRDQLCWLYKWLRPRSAHSYQTISINSKGYQRLIKNTTTRLPGQ